MALSVSSEGQEKPSKNPTSIISWSQAEKVHSDHWLEKWAKIQWPGTFLLHYLPAAQGDKYQSCPLAFAHVPHSQWQEGNCSSHMAPTYTSSECWLWAPHPNSCFMLIAWNQLWWEYLRHGNLQVLQTRALYFTGSFVKHLPAYQCIRTRILFSAVDFFYILLNTGITTFMSQHNRSRKTLSCIKILWYTHHSQLGFLTKIFICLLTGASRWILPDTTILIFLNSL